MREYKDKHGEIIKAGMFLRHDSGEVTKVIACGVDNLGFSADNPSYAGPPMGGAYPLSEFPLREWEIVKEV